jgi:hypothetical protein
MGERRRRAAAQQASRVVAFLIAIATGSAANADWLDFLDLDGSFGAAGGHQRYVPAISNPLFNETPYITTELRPLYLHNEIPSSFVSQGGHIDAGAIEARLALTDRLGFIAPKDGYAHLHFNKALNDTTGFENIAFGLKYAVWSNPAADEIISLGGLYEPPSGNLRTTGLKLQGHGGGGFFNLFVTGAKAWGPLGIQGDMGVNLAADTVHDSSMFHYAGHIDYQLADGLFAVVEANGFSVFDTGQRIAGNFEGVDLVNFGTKNAGTVITGAVGLRYQLTEKILLGAAYERPLTNRQDILGSRVYVDLVLRY